MIKYDNKNNNNYAKSSLYLEKWEEDLKRGQILSVLFTGVGGQGIILATTVLAKAAGVKNIRVVDPYNLKLLEKVLREELARNELSVVVCRRICALLEKVDKNNVVTIDQGKCNKCGVCVRFGCPAIQLRDGSYAINELVCAGCDVCVAVCKKGAILKKYKKFIKI